MWKLDRCVVNNRQELGRHIMWGAGPTWYICIMEAVPRYYQFDMEVRLIYSKVEPIYVHDKWEFGQYTMF